MSVIIVSHKNIFSRRDAFGTNLNFTNMLDNQISIVFTPQELTEMDTGLTGLEAAGATKLIGLTDEERQLFPKVRYEREPWVDKCITYMEQNPTLVPVFVDKAELDRDNLSREQLRDRLNRLGVVFRKWEDSMMLLSTDVLSSCHGFYRNVQNAATSGVPGAQEIYNDLKQQFPGRPPKVIPAGG